VAAVLIMALSGAISGCRKPPPRLLFHAGAGQRSCIDEITGIFTARHPGVKVDCSYKGSGYFLADIATSRTGDLYMPGEELYLIQAAEKGYIEDYHPETDVPAYFITVMITPRGNPKKIRSVEDFARPGVRVGLGDPEACAVGSWHEKTFKKAGVWEQVRKNATMFAKCIPELGNAVQLRAIDATIVWSPTAALYLRDVEIIPLEPRYRGFVRLPVAVLKFTEQRALAQELKAFILSDEAREIFHSHAYGLEVGPMDQDGFCADGGKATEQDMKWLVAAAAAVKDPSLPLSAATVGPLVREVKRQRAAGK
jgi:molybdate transport system substrate-binding protein